MTSITFENRPVLVLNRNWSPIGVHALRDAISKLFACYKDGTPKAHVIDVVYPELIEGVDLNPTSFEKYNWSDWSNLRPENEDEIILAGRGRKIRLPKVIALSRYDKMPTHGMNFNRRALYKRDKNRCQYCGCRPGVKNLNLDHVCPKYFGGKTTWENIVLSCIECNSKKANRTPEQAGMKLLSIPEKPKYSVIKNNKLEYKCWEQFVSDMYYEVELQNDNEE
jgi:5-methylcytosine-specific restriction endonuclease McrA